MVLECEDHLLTSLAEFGFVAGDQPWFTHHFLDLVDLAPVPAVEDYVFRPVEPGEADARAACHRAAWSDVGPSRVSTAAYQRLMAAPFYRHDLDWVAVEADGEMVASACQGSTPPRVAPIAGSAARRSTAAAGSPGPSVSPGSTRPARRAPRPDWSARGKRRLPGAGPRLPSIGFNAGPDDNARAIRHARSRLGDPRRLPSALCVYAVPVPARVSTGPSSPALSAGPTGPSVEAPRPGGGTDDAHPDHVHPRCGGARRGTRATRTALRRRGRCFAVGHHSRLAEQVGHFQAPLPHKYGANGMR
jgi:hypothetical protein